MFFATTCRVCVYTFRHHWMGVLFVLSHPSRLLIAARRMTNTIVHSFNMSKNSALLILYAFEIQLKKNMREKKIKWVIEWETKNQVKTLENEPINKTKNLRPIHSKKSFETVTETKSMPVMWLYTAAQRFFFSNQLISVVDYTHRGLMSGFFLWFSFLLHFYYKKNYRHFFYELYFILFFRHYLLCSILVCIDTYRQQVI